MASLTPMSRILANMPSHLRDRQGAAPAPGCKKCRDTGYIDVYFDEAGNKVNNYRIGDPPKFCDLCKMGAISRQHEERLDDTMAADIAGVRKAFLEAGLILPERCEAFTLEGSPLRGKDAHNKTLQFLAGWDGRKNLAYFGKTGVGKTGLMAGTLRTLQPRAVAEGWQMRFISSTTLFKQLQNGFEDKTYKQLLEKLCNVHLLAIDDIGAEHLSDWKRSEFLDIFNQRYEARKPTFLTTNFTVDGLEEYLSERTVGRLLEHCAAINVVGENLRLKGIGR